MSNVVYIPVVDSDVSAAPRLGPAEVVALERPGAVELALGNGARVTARLATTFSYEPAVGDAVLSIGNADGWFVIGVLESHGRASLTFPGDVEIHAGGSMRFSAGEDIALQSPKVSVTTNELGLFARKATEVYQSLTTTVRELFQLRAGTQHTVVEGTAHTQAARASIFTEHEVVLNGRTVHLG